MPIPVGDDQQEAEPGASDGDCAEQHDEGRWCWHHASGEAHRHEAAQPDLRAGLDVLEVRVGVEVGVGV